MYEIKTQVCGNPDFGQDPRKPPYGVRVKKIKANTFDELKTLVREWMSDNDIGGGNWQDPPLLVNGEVVVKNDTKNKDVDAIPYPATKVFSGGTRIDDYEFILIHIQAAFDLDKFSICKI